MHYFMGTTTVARKNMMAEKRNVTWKTMEKWIIEASNIMVKSMGTSKLKWSFPGVFNNNLHFIVQGVSNIENA